MYATGLFKNTVVKKVVPLLPSRKQRIPTLSNNIPDEFEVKLSLDELTACLVSLHAMSTLMDGRPHERMSVVGFHLDAEQFLSIPALKLYGDDVRNMLPLYGPLIDKLWEQLSVDDWEAL